MRSVFVMAMMLIGAFPAVQAAPPEAPPQNGEARVLAGRRQVIDCMNKNMAANRALSYNDATRLCKTQSAHVAAQQPVIAAPSTSLKVDSAP